MGDNVVSMNSKNGDSFAEILDRRLDEISHRKTQSEVAREMGFPSPNFLTMVKKGKSKMPLNRIEDLTSALDMDFKVLFTAALRQYYDDELISLMRRAFEGTMTQGEYEMMDLARRHAPGIKKLAPETKRRIVDALKSNDASLH